MLYLPRFTSVRYIRPDEPHWFDCKGHYISVKNGEQHQMSGPEVDTVRYMAGLEPAAQQFDFICMAILRHHSGVIYTMRLMNETECGRLWQKLIKKFDEVPWYGDARYVMPYDDFNYKIIDYDAGTFDRTEAERLYRDVCKSAYVLYH